MCFLAFSDGMSMVFCRALISPGGIFSIFQPRSVVLTFVRSSVVDVAVSHSAWTDYPCRRTSLRRPSSASKPVRTCSLEVVDLSVTGISAMRTALRRL